jgi:hypothetical protein
MGLLDDAIREHLDLKRRRGADPADVERAEREALGPVRRNREPADAPQPEAAVDEAGGLAYDHADDPDWSQDSLHEPEAGAPGESAFEDHDLDYTGPDPDFAPDEPAPPPKGRGWLSRRHGPADDEPSAPEPPSARPLSDMGGGETTEYNVEDVMAAEEDAEPGADDDAPDGEDVLEETPEFLQDTPDHDRLWFEQRPPRDFDFDG